jgi:type VI secretion system protein VasJ
MELQHPLLAIGTSVISEDAPCGINAKYEPTFESLEAELAKQESLTAETVDWKEVQALATDLLQNTTKDFLVASYLTHALTVNEGYNGFLVGLTILQSFAENHWQDTFPPVKRLRARKTAIEWLVEKSNHYIETTPPTDNELIVELAKTIKNLDYDLSDKMGEQAPNMADLNRTFKRLKQSAEFELKAAAEKAPAPVAAPASAPQPVATEAPVAQTQESVAEATPSVEPEPTPVAEPAPTPQPAPAATAPAPAPSGKVATVNSGPIASEGDAKKLYKQVQDALRQLADFHGQQKASDAKRYRYSRSALWDALDKLPPNKDGKTQLPKPPADKLKKLQELFDQGEYVTLLDQAEKSASKMPYWFDGQKLIANSLEALGGEYAKAADALNTELKQFVQRLPNIINLCYSDGTPFADEQTLMWLNTQVLTTDEPSASSGPTDEISQAFAEAQKAAASGKLTEGLQALQQVAAKSTRDNYRLKLASAEIIAQSGQGKTAIPLLERLIQEITDISALNWESDLVIKAYSILIQAYDKLDGEEAEQKAPQRAQAFEQLCWLDPLSVAE